MSLLFYKLQIQIKILLCGCFTKLINSTKVFEKITINKRFSTYQLYKKNNTDFDLFGLKQSPKFSTTKVIRQYMKTIYPYHIL